MKQARSSLITLSTIITLATSSFSQATSADFFVASTACDAYIKSVLKIPADEKCDFIKWELRLYKKQNSAGTFRLIALYGEAKPNTNGFMVEKKIEASGEFTSSFGVNENPSVKLFHLPSARFQTELLLAEMDHNILHFTDDHKKFLIGNGGWSYALNRIQE